eukprot:6597570-Ditylum_brightwellii.AAC.1
MEKSYMYHKGSHILVDDSDYVPDKVQEAMIQAVLMMSFNEDEFSLISYIASIWSITTGRSVTRRDNKVLANAEPGTSCGTFSQTRGK